MVIQTHERRPGAIGLVVGDGNVARYFDNSVTHVELQLDHLRILCRLQTSFWQGHAEIHDARLSSWLMSKRMSGKLGGLSAPIAMVPCGPHTFRLFVEPLDPRFHDESAIPDQPQYANQPVKFIDPRDADPEPFSMGASDSHDQAHINSVPINAALSTNGYDGWPGSVPDDIPSDLKFSSDSGAAAEMRLQTISGTAELPAGMLAAQRRRVRVGKLRSDEPEPAAADH